MKPGRRFRGNHPRRAEAKVAPQLLIGAATPPSEGGDKATLLEHDLNTRFGYRFTQPQSTNRSLSPNSPRIPVGEQVRNSRRRLEFVTRSCNSNLSCFNGIWFLIVGQYKNSGSG